MTLNLNFVTSCLLGIWTAWETFRCRRYLRTPAIRERIAVGIILTMLGLAYSTIVQKSAENLEQYRNDMMLALPVATLAQPLTDEALCQLPGNMCKESAAAKLQPSVIRRVSVTVFTDHQKLSSFFRDRLSVCSSDTKRSRLVSRYGFTTYEKDLATNRSDWEHLMAGAHYADALDSLRATTDLNTRFYTSLIAGARQARQAPWMLRICKWGLTLLCMLHLSVMWLCRRYSPGAPEWIYPGFILLTGLGFCLVTDISLNYLWKSRYISFYMFRDIIIASLIFPLVAALRRNGRVEQFVAATLSNPNRARLTALLLFIPAVIVCVYFRKSPWLVSEILKYTLIVCLAWLALFRSDYLTRRIGMTGFFRTLTDREWQWQNMKGLFITFFVFLVSVLFCHDFGTLLLMTAVVSVWIYVVMGGASFSLIALLWGIGATVLYAMRGFLSRLGVVEHIYDRFMELLTPYSYGSGETARLIWMRHSAGLYGYPLGEFPYFGFFHNRASQRIVAPKELQSDYTASHLVGLWGYLLGGLMLAACLIWFWLIYCKSCQALCSATKPMDRYIGWLLVIGAITFILQALLTIAGNGGLFALTGITLPLVSFGSTSLLFSTALVALLHSNENFEERP